MTLLKRRQILQPTNAPEDSKEEENDRIHAEPTLSSWKIKKTKKDTRQDTGYEKETDTDFQYIDYSYTYNPNCLRCKMHRFCPKDRVLLVTASLEERVSELPPPLPPPPSCTYSAPIVSTEPPRAFNGFVSCLRLDPSRIAPPEFDYRAPRETEEFLLAAFAQVLQDFDFAKCNLGGHGRGDSSTNGTRTFPPTSSVCTKAGRKPALRAK
ncbi:hypothetical protein PUN28_007063 [Cardiocondyla obscurior]|uniref:Uncharacterized protein n=1 Tax=Cardiocondyla obscurior TaxID=286306 RepID=A0AAW2G6D3_9HYME